MVYKARVMCFIVTALLILLQITCQNHEEKQYLCADQNCSKPISEFTVTLNYASPDSSEKITAKKGEEGVVLAKPPGNKPDLFKVRIANREGFLSRQYIKEGVSLVKKSELIKAKLAVYTDTVVTKSTNEIPESTNNIKSEINDKVIEEIVENESEDNATSESQNNSASTIDQSNDSNFTTDQSLPELLANDSSSNEVDNISNESSPDVDSAEIKMKPTLNPLFKKAIFNSQEVVDEDTQMEVTSDKKSTPNIQSNEKKDELAKTQTTSKTIKKEDKGDLNLIGTFKENTEKSENDVQNSQNPDDVTISPSTSNEDNQTVTGTVENVDVQNDTVVSSKTDEVKKKDDKLEDSDSENNANNLSNAEKITLPDQTSETLKPTEKVEDDSKNLSKSIEAPSSVLQAVLPEESQSISESDNNVSDESVDSQSTTSDVNIESKNVSISISESNLEGSESTASSDEVGQDGSKATKSGTDAHSKMLPKLFDPHISLIPQSVESDAKNDRKLTNTSEVDLQPDPKEMEKVTNSDNISEKDGNVLNSTYGQPSQSDIQIEQTTKTNPLDAATSGSIPYEIPPPTVLTEATTESVQPDSTQSIPISEAESVTSLPVVADQPDSIPPIPIVTQDISSEPISDSQSHEPSSSHEQFTAELTKTNFVPSVEPFQSQTSKPTPEPTNPLGEFESDQQPGLSDFIHAPRKKVNENEIETFDSQDEKSIYETIQGYLPDLSGFQVNDILPMSSIESAKSFFSFGFSAQEEEEREFCSTEEFCGTDRLNSLMDDRMFHKSPEKIVLPFWGEVSHEYKEKIVWTCGFTSVCTLILILLLTIMNYVKKKNKNSFFVSRINQLENKLLIATKEIVALQDQLTEADFQNKEKQNVVETKRITQVYEHKINQYKKRIVELEDKVLYLEKELESVSSSALEMHKLLENSLTTQAHSKAAIDEVDILRSLTESQEIQIEELRREINSIVTENQCLKVDNEMDKSAIKKLEKECSIQIKKNLELSEKNKNLTLQLDNEIENNSTIESNYKSEIYQLRSKLEDVEMNLKRSEFQVQELNRAFIAKQEGKSATEVQAACDDMQLKIQISTLEAMNVELSGQLKEEKSARRMLEEHVGDVIKELNNLKKTYEISEKERNEAVTKLQVLTQYFKDKEAQLHKELEAKDKLYTERESKDQSLSQKLASMRDEISHLRMQNEELKKEILDQETSFKTQLANAEQKTREHWFALRQAERKYKECEQEASNLRNKILLLENKLSSLNQKGDDKNNSGINGDMPSMIYHPPLSPDLLPYPSPSEFIPPPPSPIPSHSPDFFPPEPLYSPDERLPPLGSRRAPTPPPPIIPDDDEFTPPPPMMKYPPGRSRNAEPPVSSYSRRTPPPGTRHRSQFKPRQPRSSIDSPSSGMSLESLDKSGR